MKITLISPYSSASALGLRSVSSSLKKAGHQVDVLLLTRHPVETVSNYDQRLIDEVIEVSRGSDIIGVSLMAEYYLRSAHLTENMKKAISAPFIWGGIQPTSKPEECLRHADMVCIGEGEGAMIELAEKMERGESPLETQNIWFRTNGSIKKNGTRPLIQNLEELPPGDYGIETHYIIGDDGSLTRLTPQILESRLKLEEAVTPGGVAYQTMFTRGCPYKCSYCCNDIYHTLYKGEKIVRKRSAESLVSEIKDVLARFPFINNVWFHDDSFFAVGLQDMDRFCELYKKEINLPFCALGDPKLTSEDKMARLVDAGLQVLQVGVQSGSPRILELYKRKHFKPESVLSLGRTVNKFTGKMRVRYDVITDNPYETSEDTLATVKLFVDIPYPYTLNIFSLTFFPETELYRKAKQDGLVEDEMKAFYKKKFFAININYMNVALLMLLKNFPKIIVKMMISKPAMFMFDRKWTSTVLLFMYRTYRYIKRILIPRRPEDDSTEHAEPAAAS